MTLDPGLAALHLSGNISHDQFRAIRDEWKGAFMHPPRLVVTSLVLVVLASLVHRSLAAQNGTPPNNVTFTVVVSPGDPPASCAFPISISAEGKGKTIELPGGATFIFTSPNLNATVSNLDTAKQVSLNITGSFHQTTEPDGTVVSVATGRNLLIDPVAGVVLAIGNFSFAFDAAGNLTQPLTMQGGSLINLCALIE
jgi:hypothetical protein